MSILSESESLPDVPPDLLDGSSDESDGCSYRALSPKVKDGSDINVVNKIFQRQLYAKFKKNPRAKTEQLFNDLHYKCRYRFSEILPTTPSSIGHVFMGFTICGQYFVSYTQKVPDDIPLVFTAAIEYELYIWRFVAGERLRFVSSHRIFKHHKRQGELINIKIMQFPSDPYKLICYGIEVIHPVMAYITILMLPSPANCNHCKADVDEIRQGWCTKHGFILHYMLAMAHPTPKFEPQISLAFPDHVVVNTGHHVHILSCVMYKPPKQSFSFPHFIRDDERLPQPSSCIVSDNMSEISESTSDNFGASSIVDSILEDFSEHDLEGNDCNKPFHELNISCEPLNVTGKSYRNTLNNIVDSRTKKLQSKDCVFSIPQCSSSQKNTEKPKIDKKIAEKAYEFIEENEKCEKISSFRKKRLADKKYEFSEDNSENIIPFNSLRRERRYLYRSQNRCIRSPDFNSSLFLSPGLRSPMQSPNSRSQFSPSGIRNLCCSSLRSSPHHSKSPVSPRDNARKFNVYSPSLDSDCSDSDSKLILRQINNFPTSRYLDSRPHSHNGLLVIDNKREETSGLIKKIVRRYSSGDFENGSLVSGQSRDDYNIPIELPLLVQTMSDQQLDVVPEFRADNIAETQIIVTQKTIDCDQFILQRCHKLCSDSQLEYRHCEDYEIIVLHICPLSGDVVCQVTMGVGAGETTKSGKPPVYYAVFLFLWNMITDRFDLIESENTKLVPLKGLLDIPLLDIPKINCKSIHVMDQKRYNTSKTSLRDYHDLYEIYMTPRDIEEDWLATALPDPMYNTASDSE